MRVAPTSMAPPWSYQASKNLKAPTSALTFADFRQRVRRFSRIGLVTVGTRLCWYAWDHIALLDPAAPSGFGNLVTQIYAERLVSLACIAAPDDPNRPWPTEIEFRLLCWELHTCSDAGWLSDTAIEELCIALRVFPSDHVLRNLDRNKVRGLLAVALKARLAYQQTDGRKWDAGSLLRPWLMTNEFGSRARQIKGNRFNDFEKHFFMTSPDGFVRSAWAVFAKANQGVMLAPRYLAWTAVGNATGSLKSSLASSR